MILFGDVCGEPQSSPANMISSLLADRGKIPKVSGILASAPGRVSLEKEDLKHGVYGYYLVSSGSHGSINIPALWSALAKPVKDATNGSQRPIAPLEKRAPLYGGIAFAPRPDDPLVAFPRYSVRIGVDVLVSSPAGVAGPDRKRNFERWPSSSAKSDETQDPETPSYRGCSI